VASGACLLALWARSQQQQHQGRSSRRQRHPRGVGASWGQCWVLREERWVDPCWEAPCLTPCLGETRGQSGWSSTVKTCDVHPMSLAWLLRRARFILTRWQQQQQC
jgi:hypothetical protein